MILELLALYIGRRKRDRGGEGKWQGKDISGSIQKSLMQNAMLALSLVALTHSKRFSVSPISPHMLNYVSRTLQLMIATNFLRESKIEVAQKSLKGRKKPSDEPHQHPTLLTDF